MPRTLTHGANAGCPDVQSGKTARCHGHTEVTPEENLHNAILSFAHAVNNDFEEVTRALRKAGHDELVDDLTKLRDEWRDASQAAFDSFNR